MRDMFIEFKKSESGASLVEYAVALIVVTLVGGAGVLAVGSQSGAAVDNACTIVETAATAGGAAGTTGC